MPLPDTQAELAASFTKFLTVAIHQIIYLRSVYPRVTFLPVRAYDFPLRQSRHPKVCEYIRDVVAAVETEILKGTVAAAYVIVTSISSNQPMERFAFDLSEFPRVAEEDLCTTFEERGLATALSAVDMEAQFRACLSRLTSACERLAPLPADDEFGFTVCIEVREDALPPAGTTKAEANWIIADPGRVNLQSRSAPSSLSKAKDGKQQQQQPSPRIPSEKAKTVPVRRVEAGELRFEVWVEEARQKFENPPGS
ncbi:hypothetical protein Egran_06975 [Elaphomyces granulatus]|uniref:HORMA domain-containing protein n=1 Tax=Elaphomyces granulatus TaxID=519963 RepID=A0A232LN62_9EURO|nr:hypothetical protein Egran_06975 [Elaphomyces granulatus]